MGDPAEDLARTFALDEPLRITEGITHRQLRLILNEAAVDAEAAVIDAAGKTNVGAVVQRSRGKMVAAALTEVEKEMWGKTGKVIQAGMYQQAFLAADQGLDLDLLKGMPPLAAIQLADALHFEAAQAVEDIISRKMNGFTLSQRIYRNGQRGTKAVGHIVDKALAQGLSARQLAAQVKGHYKPNVPGGSSYAAMRLARTEINNAHHDTTIRMAQEKPWVQGFKWNLSGSHVVPDECNEYAAHDEGLGQGVFKKGNVPSKPHPQCVTSNTMVRGPSLEGVMSRWFEGEVIEINTIYGNSLTVTPNHPILTPRGWVAAGKLHAGEYVITDGRDVERNRTGQSGSFSIPYNQDVPTRIDDIATTFRPSFGGSSTTMPVSPEDFHGDGFDGDVNIVWTDSFLQNWIKTSVEELLSYLECLGRYAELSLLSGNGGLTLGLERWRDASLSIVSRFGAELSDFWRSNVGDLLMVPQWNVGTAHSSSNNTNSDLSDGSSFLESLSGQIQLDQITVLNRVWYSGHVFNLQTSGGYYISNGIVTHNCLCYLTHVSDDMDTFINGLAQGQYDPYLGKRGVKC